MSVQYLQERPLQLSVLSGLVVDVSSCCYLKFPSVSVKSYSGMVS